VVTSIKPNPNSSTFVERQTRIATPLQIVYYHCNVDLTIDTQRILLNNFVITVTVAGRYSVSETKRSCSRHSHIAVLISCSFFPWFVKRKKYGIYCEVRAKGIGRMARRQGIY
ncbi:uncharacterized protein LOC120349366, partial [Nilaparvata lugens]|uniref:uncharacterized protein LOC120349366 n=1 Tax=Nilaparvata lugens TaxID=108931 RepID=UPI00193DD53B